MKQIFPVSHVTGKISQGIEYQTEFLPGHFRVNMNGEK
nr:MAG TPA: hypothetical protein [Caudoviricetes sp.]